jgi:uncharacterized protein YqjF (DUF2071 family)
MVPTRIRHLPLEETGETHRITEVLQPQRVAARPMSQHQPEMKEILSETSHRPWPLPRSAWTMTQRWNDLLFAHWPVPVADLADLVPSQLTIDTFDGSAWVAITPFWMDRIRLRGMPLIPGANHFPELNLRTYVRDRHSNMSGVYFFSLDAANPAAVVAARTLFKLPYYWAHMKIESQDQREFHYQSTRLLTLNQVRFRARYRSLQQPSAKGGLETFLTERYCLYTTDKRGTIYRGNIHHLPWPLEMAEAEIEINELPQAHGIQLPDTKPLLHYARELVVYIWQLELLPALGKHAAAAPVPVAKPL